MIPLPFPAYFSPFDDVILLWIIVLGLIAFVLMGYDRLAAKLVRKRRVREKNFWLVAALGGFVGIEIGAVVFHHKVSKISFWPPIIAATALWLILFYFLKIV